MNKPVSPPVSMLLPIMLFLFLVAASVAVAQEPAPTPPEAGLGTHQKPKQQDNLIFPGKLFASIKRAVILSYPGIVLQANILPGSAVGKGESIFDYTLDTATRNKLLRSIAPISTNTQELRLADLNDALSDLNDKIDQAKNLVEANMAPASSLGSLQQKGTSIEQSIKLLEEGIEETKRINRQRVEALSRELGSDKITENSIPASLPVTSPITGHVLWIDEGIRQDGQFNAGSPVAVVGVLNPMTIRAQVFELEAGRIKIGDHMRFRLETMPDRLFPATVSRISWIPMDNNFERPSYYEVELTCPNPELLFRDGFKVQVSF